MKRTVEEIKTGMEELRALINNTDTDSVVYDALVTYYSALDSELNNLEREEIKLQRFRIGISNPEGLEAFIVSVINRNK